MNYAHVATALAEMPQVSLAMSPTPLDEAPRLAERVGVGSLLIKRDDNTGLALGGNKARKLEFLVGDALSMGADTLITGGGAQSNHCRMTAAAARRCGMEALLVFDGETIDEVQGNMILDRLLGARWSFVGPDGSREDRMEGLARELERQGRHPYVVPSGGTNGRGILGYVKAGLELADQLTARNAVPECVYCATGSCGTLAGLALGLHLSEIPTIATGVSVSDRIPDKERVVYELIDEAAQLLGLSNPECEVRVLNDFVGDGYGRPTESSRDAWELAAITEGLVLDPVYTAKAMAGLIGDVRDGSVNRSAEVVFVHTGGSPALFADQEIYWPK